MACRRFLCRLDLVEQIGVTVEHLEQFHQRQRRLGLAVFVARKRSDPAAENFGGFALVERELPADAGDEARIDNRGIHLFDEIISLASKILVLTTEEPEADETRGQSFAIADEITRLYARAFDIDLSHVESVFEADADPAIKERVRVEQKVYLLTPNG